MSLLGLVAPISDVSGGRSTPVTDTGGTFVATNPTPGTGIVTGVAVTLAAAATAPSMLVVNNNAPNSNVNIYPLYLKLTEDGRLHDRHGPQLSVPLGYGQPLCERGIDPHAGQHAVR